MSVNLKTKRGRNSFYKKLLKVVCEDPSVDQGLCYYIGNVMTGSPDRTTRILTGMNYMSTLAELHKQKPKHYFIYWYPLTTEGWKKRIACIEKAIELTN